MPAQEVLRETKDNIIPVSHCIKEVLNFTNKYKTFAINNRRYLGNKYKLNSFIKKVIGCECGDFETFADLFAGTGAVASMFQDKTLIVNDILYSNFICYDTWFGIEKFSLDKIIEYVKYYNNFEAIDENYMSQNYENTYFSKKVCKKIGFVREDIEDCFRTKKINSRERSILITSLLYAMDRIANTCGHYDAYRKSVELNKNIEMLVPNIKANNKYNKLYNIDINKLVKVIEADVVYLDPPYNSRQYCDAYHLLENVAKWEKPNVVGVAKKMDRTNLKSDYCTQKAVEAFEDLIENINAKYIVLSYNNMASKGNDRSNAKISDDDIERILGNKGTFRKYEESYKAFSTGKSLIEENKERLFVCKCYGQK